MPALATPTRAAVLCVIAALTTTAIAHAQLPTIPVGTRVRINAAWPNTDIVGKVASQAADSIAVKSRAGTRSVPAAAVKRIDVSRGRSHSNGAVRGMAIGAIAVGGTVAGLLVADHFTFHQDCGGDECIDGLAFAPLLVPLGAMVGGFAGGVVALLVGSEQWDSLYSTGPRVSILPQQHGATTLGLSLRF